MKKKLIELKNICKAFDGEPVLSNIDLYINDKEFITLLGPSGCGKTTQLLQEAYSKIENIKGKGYVHERIKNRM